MGLYRVKNQWGGSAAPWRQGGQWVIGNRSKQDVVALNIKSKNGGKTLTGTMTYRGEGPIGFLATKESQGKGSSADSSTKNLQLRIRQLEARLITQKEQYQQMLERQKQAFEQSIANLKNVTESETKASILAAVNAAKDQAQQAESDILLAKQKQRRAEILSLVTSKILDLNKSEEDTELLQESVAQLVQEARQVTLEVTRSPLDSAMAIAAHNSAQQAMEYATTAEQQLASIKEEQVSAQAALEAEKQNLEELDVESGSEAQASSTVIETAEMTLQQLEAEDGSLAKIERSTTAARESQEEAELALLLATQQAKLAAEAYDNWATVEDMFGFSSTEENPTNDGETQIVTDLPDTFADHDNWQVIGDLFGIPDNPETNSPANQKQSAATESSNL